MSEEKTDTSDNIEESNVESELENDESENRSEGSSELVKATQAQAKQFSESIKNSLESLVSVVLDSAEVANKSAEVSSNSTRSLLRGVDRLNSAHSKGSKQSLFVLFICGFLLTLALSFYTVMGVKLQEKISQVDAMLLAIGKRVLDMDSGVEALNNMRDAVDKFSLDQITLKESVEDTKKSLKNEIQQSFSKSYDKTDNIPQLTAMEVETKNKALDDKILIIDEKINSQENLIKNQENLINSQSATIKSLNGEIDNLTSQMGKLEKSILQMNKISQEVEAMVFLQKQRYLEVLSEISDNQREAIKVSVENKNEDVTQKTQEIFYNEKEVSKKIKN